MPGIDPTQPITWTHTYVTYEPEFGSFHTKWGQTRWSEQEIMLNEEQGCWASEPGCQKQGEHFHDWFETPGPAFITDRKGGVR